MLGTSVVLASLADISVSLSLMITSCMYISSSSSASEDSSDSLLRLELEELLLPVSASSQCVHVCILSVDLSCN